MVRLGIAILLAGSLAASAETTVDDLVVNEQRVLSASSDQNLETLLERPDIDITYSAQWLDQQSFDVKGDDWRCLAEALYFEARGESVRGQFAVAEVVLNRVDNPDFPDTVCAVVHQGTGRKYQCQFTYTCDGHKEVINEPRAFESVGKVAHLMVEGAPRPLTKGATHYHTRAVSPNWARVYPRVATIGVHHFYKRPTRVSSY